MSSVSPTNQDLSNDATFSQIKSRVPVPLNIEIKDMVYNFIIWKVITQLNEKQFLTVPYHHHCHCWHCQICVQIIFWVVLIDFHWSLNRPKRSKNCKVSQVCTSWKSEAKNVTFHCAVFFLNLHNSGRSRVPSGLQWHRGLLQSAMCSDKSLQHGGSRVLQLT